MVKVKIKKEVLDYGTEESYKSLRTNLLFCGEDKKVIAFTSCTQGEGKSSVVTNLANSLAEFGKKVLILDTDLRKSVLVGRYHVQEDIKGLTHYLSSQTSMEEIICQSNINNLDIIFAGPVPPNPAELLGTNKLERLVQEKKNEYDYILIDTAPLGIVIDAAIVSRVCDGIIMVIESGEVSYRFAQGVLQQLEKTKCPVLGAVVNKVNLDSQTYYGKYGNYGNYGKKKTKNRNRIFGENNENIDDK